MYIFLLLAPVILRLLLGGGVAFGLYFFLRTFLPVEGTPHVLLALSAVFIIGNLWRGSGRIARTLLFSIPVLLTVIGTYAQAGALSVANVAAVEASGQKFYGNELIQMGLIVVIWGFFASFIATTANYGWLFGSLFKILGKLAVALWAGASFVGVGLISLFSGREFNSKAKYDDIRERRDGAFDSVDDIADVLEEPLLDESGSAVLHEEEDDAAAETDASDRIILAQKGDA